MSLQKKFETLKDHAGKKIPHAKSIDELKELEIHFLGRKGELATLMKGMAEADPSERPKLGKTANEVKTHITEALDQKRSELLQASFSDVIESERADVTEPGQRPPSGSIHVVERAIEEITEIFERAGFNRVRHPEVEWDWYAFEALNMPGDHPARDEWETFFMDAPEAKKWGRMLLTPHATSGTARTLADQKPPIRAINISKTYRRQIDVTHVPMFHQFDGVFVDENVSVTNLLGILDYFVKTFFGEDREVRIRPFHFRFTEPSFEVDISCGVCGGSGKLEDGSKCRTCKRGWLELGGAGMLHPNVLKAANIDPDNYSGLAFGFGVERTYMMKEGLQLDDIRLLYKNDLRFLKQF